MCYSPDKVKSPELKKLIFPARKQRPAEARFMVWKNSFFSEDLKRQLEKASTNYL